MAQNPKSAEHDSGHLDVPTYDFAHISPAILELITHFLNGYDILALCMTCSKPLFARIRAGGAKRFSIGPADVSGWSAEGFGMLQYFPRLTTISIRQSSLKVWKMGPKLFESFPPTVRSISLRIPIPLGEWLMIGAYRQRILEDAPAEEPEPTASPSSPVAATTPKRAPPKRNKRRKAPTPEVGAKPILPQLVPQTLQPTSSAKLKYHDWVPQFHMSRQFPSLEVLEITGGVKYSARAREESIYGKEKLGLVKCHFAASLPATMQRVSLPEMGVFAWMVPASLPPTVSQLELVVMEADAPEAAARHFPRDLQHLTLATRQALDSAKHGRIFFDLPSSIEKLEWSFSSAGSVNPVLSVLTDLLVLPNLIHLELDIDFTAAHNTYPTLGEWFSYLPRRLETLKVNGRPLASKYAAWSSLPSSLTRLHMFTLSVELTHGGQWPLGKWGTFPPCLTDLQLGGYLVLNDSDFEAWPRSLTRLSLETHPTSFYHDCDLLGHSRTICEATTRRAAQRPFAGLTDSAALTLPSSLESLILHSTMFGADFWSNLPETLTHLDMATNRHLSDNDLAFLPASLTHLRVYQAPNVNPFVYSQLPPTLTKLEILDGQVFTNRWTLALGRLPPNLTHLVIENCTSICDQHVASLPRGLTALEMPHAPLLTARCAAHLPRPLQSLKIKRFCMPGDYPIITKAMLSQDMPQWLPFDELPWVIGKSNGRKIDLQDFFSRQVVLPLEENNALGTEHLATQLSHEESGV